MSLHIIVSNTLFSKAQVLGTQIQNKGVKVASVHIQLVLSYFMLPVVKGTYLVWPVYNVCFELYCWQLSCLIICLYFNSFLFNIIQINGMFRISVGMLSRRFRSDTLEIQCFE